MLLQIISINTRIERVITIFASRKIRIYPSTDQIQTIENTFNCCRFVWNKLLEYYIENNEVCNYGDIVLRSPFLDKHNTELSIDRHSINNTKNFFNKALKSYFKRLKDKPFKIRKDGHPTGFPRFKSKKHCKNSYTSYHYENIRFNKEDHLIKLPCLGWVKYNPRENRIPDYQIKHITISKSGTNKYYCSIVFEYIDDIIGVNGQNFIINPKDTLSILGIDYSSSSLYVDSYNNTPSYPKYYRNSQKKLRILNKQLSRRKKGGFSRSKTLKKLHNLHEHISNQRKDFLHKLSNVITKHYDIICVEDIDMRSISQGLKLGKSTYDNAFGMFRNMLSYKQDRIPFHLLIRADKWYPSSKTCSQCGYINKELKLSDRIYNCPHCGQSINRDLNAAINLKKYAIVEINNIHKGFRKFQIAK